MIRQLHAAVVLVAAASLAGCGPAPPAIVRAEGIVLLDGRPLPKAKVRFIPVIERPNRYSAQATTDDDGRFVLECNGAPGAYAGENIVLVGEDDIPTRLTPEGARAELQAYLRTLKNRPIPAEYGDTANSPLTVNVTAERQEYKIELKR
jgi:hypothetical protein